MQETKNPEISIIIPVYNVEPYIRRCLDSIKAQTLLTLKPLLLMTHRLMEVLKLLWNLLRVIQDLR